MAASARTPAWPLEKVKKVYKSLVDEATARGSSNSSSRTQEDKQACVITVIGALNPCFKCHVLMLKQAQARLEAAGFVVLGSFLSPADKTSVKEQAKAKGVPALSPELRIQLAELAVRGVKDDCQVASWQALQTNKVSVIQALESLQDAIKKELDTVNIRCFVVSGSGSQKRLNLKLVSPDRIMGVVLVPQGEDVDLEAPAKMKFVADPVPEMKSLSCSTLMNSLRSGDTGYVEKMMGKAQELFFDNVKLQRDFKVDYEAIQRFYKATSTDVPAEKFRQRLRSVPDDHVQLAVIVVEGAVNVAHRGHVRMCWQARRRLETAGFYVVAAWIVPSIAQAAEAEAATKKTPATSLGFRRRVAELSVCDDDFVDVACPPSLSSNKPFEVLKSIEDDIKPRFNGSLQGRTFKVFYACGVDAATAHRALKKDANLDTDRLRGVVVVPRNDDEVGVTMEDTKRDQYVAEEDENDASPNAAGLSSTQLRAYIASGNVTAVSRAMAAAAARFVMAPTLQERKKYEADFAALGVQEILVAIDSVNILKGKLKSSFPTVIKPDEMKNILVSLDPSWTSQEFDSLFDSALKRKGKTDEPVSVDDFVDWIFSAGGASGNAAGGKEAECF